VSVILTDSNAYLARTLILAISIIKNN
jgi:hypothetical protein